MQQKNPIVHAAGVTKISAGHASLTVVFNEMTVTLPTDQICAVLGRPGSGRTTFLQLISGAKRPDSGSILTEMHFSVIGNGAAFFNPAMTGLENIKLAARLHAMDPAILTETTLGLSRFGADWQLPASALSGPRRRAMEMLLAALLPFDCYLVDDADRADPETFETVLQIIALRQAGMIFTTRNPRFAREFATFGSVITNQTVYAFASVDEALKNYA